MTTDTEENHEATWFNSTEVIFKTRTKWLMFSESITYRTDPPKEKISPGGFLEVLSHVLKLQE